MEFQQCLSLRFRKTELADVRLSIPHLEELRRLDRRLLAVDRGPGVRQVRLQVPGSVDWADHLQHLFPAWPVERLPHDVVLAAVEPFLNIGLPLFCQAEAGASVLCGPDEPMDWSYVALVLHAEGYPAIEFLRLEDEPGRPAVTVLGRHVHRPVTCALVGVPVVLDGKPLDPAAVGSRSSDFRLLWQICFEDWQLALCTGDRERQALVETHRRIHDELMNVLQAHLHSPADVRGQALLDVAEQACLAPSAYFRTSLGISRTGDITLLVGHGTVQEVAEAHQKLGADRAILLAHGGSAGIAYQARRCVDRGEASPKPLPLVPLALSSYFRPAFPVALAFCLREDLIESPFLPVFSTRAFSNSLHGDSNDP